MPVYVNPTAAPGGTGATAADPLQAPPTTGWGPGVEVVQRAGTTLVGGYAPNSSGTAGSRALIGVYDETGAIVRDGSRVAYVRPPSGVVGINLAPSGTRNFFDVIGLNVITAGAAEAMFGRAGVDSTERANVIRHCFFSAPGGAGANLRGNGWTFEDTTFTGCLIDGLILEGRNLLVNRCRSFDNDQERDRGDGIQVFTGDVTVGSIRILNTYIQNPGDSTKQGLIINSSSGATGDVLIEGCEFEEGGGSSVALGIPGARVVRSRFRRTSNAVSVLAADLVIEHNAAMLCGTLAIFTSNAGTGAIIRNNTAIADPARTERRGIYNTTGAASASWTAQNNVLVGFVTGILGQSSNSSTNSHNAFWQCGASYGGSASGGSDVTADPRITPDGRPLPGSPLLTGGADLGYVRDIRGLQSRRHIGAYGKATTRRIA
jgi:hypothetical protein